MDTIHNKIIGHLRFAPIKELETFYSTSDLQARFHLWQDSLQPRTDYYIDKNNTVYLSLTGLLMLIKDYQWETTKKLIKDYFCNLDEKINTRIVAKYTVWKTETFNKLNHVAEVRETSIPNIIRQIIGMIELQTCYVVGDYVEEYKEEFNLNKDPYVLDVIEYNEPLRNLFDEYLTNVYNKL